MRISGDLGVLSLAALRPAAPPPVAPVSLNVSGPGQATPPTSSPAGPPPRAAHFAGQTLSALLDLQSAEAPDETSGPDLSEIDPAAPVAEGEEAGETEPDLETAETSDAADSAATGGAAEQPVASLDGAGADDGDADQEDLEVAADDGSTQTTPPQPAPAQVRVA